jgi:carbohydrate-selective porin OprB
VPLPQTQSGAVGLNAEWAITPDVGIFGRFAFGWSNANTTRVFVFTETTTVNGKSSTSSTFSNISTTTYSETNSWSVGLNFPRLFRSAGTLGISVGQVPRASLIQTSNGSASDPLNLPISSGRETDLEVFYRLPIGDRITLTPDLQMIFDPLNVAGNPIITIGTMRAVFSF